MPLHIRPFHEADAPTLRAVFESSVHTLAAPYYTPAERAAWAPRAHDAVQWAERMRALQPFVAELDGRIAGFADLQPSGYIDMFFVAGGCGGRGVARALMAWIEASAHERGIGMLFADVSLAAETFFERAGFEVEQRQTVERAGVALRNARMTRTLAPAA
ncbi:GNAT family N-acetyltransferase [Variovorax sp. LT1R16]|uniref:GNAT family N-acetyltransferase n=1 Tax=Variovorax sp. LT1R16 TaxID=3443728 RepID=UPI003F469AC9